MRRVEKHLPAYFRERWHYGRVKDIWDRQARRIDAEEMDAIRAAAQSKLAQEARHEFQELTSRIARLEALAVLQRPDMDGAEADAVRTMARGPHRPLGGE